jgi:hypothetical protein
VARGAAASGTAASGVAFAVASPAVTVGDAEVEGFIK